MRRRWFRRTPAFRRARRYRGPTRPCDLPRGWSPRRAPRPPPYSRLRSACAATPAADECPAGEARSMVRRGRRGYRPNSSRARSRARSVVPPPPTASVSAGPATDTRARRHKESRRDRRAHAGSFPPRPARTARGRARLAKERFPRPCGMPHLRSTTVRRARRGPPPGAACHDKPGTPWPSGIAAGRLGCTAYSVWSRVTAGKGIRRCTDALSCATAAAGARTSSDSTARPTGSLPPARSHVASAVVWCTGAWSRDLGLRLPEIGRSLARSETRRTPARRQSHCTQDTRHADC